MANSDRSFVEQAFRFGGLRGPADHGTPAGVAIRSTPLTVVPERIVAAKAICPRSLFIAPLRGKPVAEIGGQQISEPPCSKLTIFPIPGSSSPIPATRLTVPMAFEYKYIASSPVSV